MAENDAGASLFGRAFPPDTLGKLNEILKPKTARTFAASLWKRPKAENGKSTIRFSAPSVE